MIMCARDPTRSSRSSCLSSASELENASTSGRSCAPPEAAPFFFQAEDGIRDRDVTWSSDVCSSDLSVVALVGPGGQGKTAIVRHWLERFTLASKAPLDGLFFWSFYRGKDVDRCLREWLAYAEGRSEERRVGKEWRGRGWRCGSQGKQ